jgi:hypothetical protein
MVEHSSWPPDDKSAYLIATLNELVTHILHSVPTGAMYEEVTVVLENRYADHHLAEAFHAQLRRVQHAGKLERESAGSQLRAAVAEAGDSSGTQRKRNVCRWNLLPSNTLIP